MVRDCHSLVYHSRQTIQIEIVLWYAWSASLLVLANLSSSTREDLRTWAPLYLTLRLIIAAVQRFPNEGLIGDTRGVCWRVKDIIVTIAFVNVSLFHSDLGHSSCSGAIQYDTAVSLVFLIICEQPRPYSIPHSFSFKLFQYFVMTFPEPLSLLRPSYYHHFDF